MKNTLGIDVSKLKLDLALHAEGKRRYKVFKNQSQDFPKILEWIQNTEKLHICLEATGTYGEAIALFLCKHGYQVSLVNPARVKAFAACQLSRQKTDKVDAHLIAQFCLSQNPEVWKAPSAELRALKSLVRHLESLNRQRTRLLNRMQSGETNSFVMDSLNKQLDFIEEEIRLLEAKLQEHTSSAAELSESVSLLESIPGIGKRTAWSLLAEIPDLNVLSSARQLAAYSGLTPRHHVSGSSIHGKSRISKLGNARLRHCLYMPALVAMRCNPILKSLSDRLRASGKAGKVIVCAVMRKMLHIVYGVLKHRKNFQTNFLLFNS